MDIFKHCHLSFDLDVQIHLHRDSLDFEVTASLQAGLTETWPKKQQR